MSPLPLNLYARQQSPTTSDNNSSYKWNWRKDAGPEDLILESWSEGFMVGSLLLMSAITIANMRRGVLLHKLILLEQMLALTHGTFCFMDFHDYGYYLSSTATLLYCSYFLHNVVAWMKIKPFFEGRTIFQPRFVFWTKRIYLTTLACTIPPLIFEIFNNFRYFNGLSKEWYYHTRPYEPLMRDPWWLFTCGILFYVLSRCYGMGVMTLVRKSPRFAILLLAIVLAVIFTVLDVVASIHNFIGTTDGINPFWKLAVCYKCLTDAILLDDFKTELKRLGVKRIQRDEKTRQSFALVLDEDDPDLIHPTDDVPNGRRYTNGSISNGSFFRSSFANRSPKANKEELEFGDALDMDSSQTDGMDSGRQGKRSSSPRAQVGRGGKRATKLPGLKVGGMFESIKPSRKSKDQDNKSLDDDEEEAEQNISPTATRQSPQVNEDLERARRMNAETISALSREQGGGNSSAQRLRGFRSSLGAWDEDSE